MDQRKSTSTDITSSTSNNSNNNNNSKSKSNSDKSSNNIGNCSAGTSMSTRSTIKIRVKCNNNNTNEDLTITISLTASVDLLKDKIRLSMGSNVSRDQYLRLICSGRLLAPDTIKLSEFQCIKNDCVVHAVLAAPGVRGGQQATLSRERRHPSVRRFRGMGVGSNGLILPRRTDADEDEDEDIELGGQRLGFDRLRANGLSRSEINALRIYFSSQVDRFIEQRNQLRPPQQQQQQQDQNNSNNNSNNSSSSSNENTTTNSNTDENPRLQRFRMEDEWMERQGPHSEFHLNVNSNNTINPFLLPRSSQTLMNNMNMDIEPTLIANNYRSGIGSLGTDRDLIWGFVLGYTFGFMTMLFLWLPTVPHKQRVGILSGLCFHMAMSVFAKELVKV